MMRRFVALFKEYIQHLAIILESFGGLTILRTNFQKKKKKKNRPSSFVVATWILLKSSMAFQQLAIVEKRPSIPTH
jgi:hypothetical protein